MGSSRFKMRVVWAEKNYSRAQTRRTTGKNGNYFEKILPESGRVINVQHDIKNCMPPYVSEVGSTPMRPDFQTDKFMKFFRLSTQSARTKIILNNLFINFAIYDGITEISNKFIFQMTFHKSFYLEQPLQKYIFKVHDMIFQLL